MTNTINMPREVVEQEIDLILTDPESKLSAGAERTLRRLRAALFAAAEQVKGVQAGQPVVVPKGFALVPLKMNAEMRRVTEDEWDWPDLLAAANAITEDQYDDLCVPDQPEPTPAVPDAAKPEK